jgi:hypothetical protein
LSQSSDIFFFTNDILFVPSSVRVSYMKRCALPCSDHISRIPFCGGTGIHFAHWTFGRNVVLRNLHPRLATQISPMTSTQEPNSTDTIKHAQAARSPSNPSATSRKSVGNAIGRELLSLYTSFKLLSVYINPGLTLSGFVDIPLEDPRSTEDPNIVDSDGEDNRARPADWP